MYPGDHYVHAVMKKHKVQIVHHGMKRAVEGSFALAMNPKYHPKIPYSQKVVFLDGTGWFI